MQKQNRQLKTSLRENGMIKENVSVDSGIWAKVPLSPNQITTISLILSLFAVILIYLSPNYILASFSLFILAFLFDAIDGAVARAKKLVSNKGAFIDGVFDRIVDFSIILSLYVIVERDVLLFLNFNILGFEINLIFLTLVFTTLLPSFITAYADHRKALTDKKVKQIPTGFGRAERSILLLLSYLLIIFGMLKWMLLTLILIILISLWTAFVRFSFVIKHSQ